MINQVNPMSFIRGAFIGAALALASAAFAAQTFTVNSTLDQIDDTMCHTAANTCTLRAAIMQANRSPDDGATIILPAGTYTLTILPAMGDGEESGDLNLTTPASGNPVIRIVGAGAASTIIDANKIDRVFFIDQLRTAWISGVTIRNGYNANTGGGIKNVGVLTLDGVIVAGNYSGVNGGGIANFGSLDVRNSALVSNIAATDGGGLYDVIYSSATVTATTIALNTAGSGGGIKNNATITIMNSTIAGNMASYYGGGIDTYLFLSSDTFNIYNSTIAYNDAGEASRSSGAGGGISTDLAAAPVNLYNTLLAGNTDTPIDSQSVFDDCSGPLTSHARNLFGTIDGCTINTVSGAWAFLNDTTLLGPLQNNGGPTQTIALLPGSNAVDDGVYGCFDPYSFPILTDQRGFPRNVGPCDIGAFEYGALNPNDVIFKNGFELQKF